MYTPLQKRRMILAVVASSMPCDGGMSQYTLIERQYNVPTFRLDVPYHFYSERAVDYFVSELRRLIAFLDSERVNARTDDDKTLVLAVRRSPGGPP